MGLNVQVRRDVVVSKHKLATPASSRLHPHKSHNALVSGDSRYAPSRHPVTRESET